MADVGVKRDAADRFELRGELGSGGVGIVYRVFDRERGEEVALKTLRSRSGRDIYRFKREFRSLAELEHPNLVRLHELFSVGEEWMFTMELVDGKPFTDRASLPQLVDGVCALHAAGKIHRDLKPSNVLVEAGGRVVILDFGLISDVDPHHADRTHEHTAVGTPAYMSPEQAADLPLTPASDWYSVGTMLYEILSGKRPYAMTSYDVLVEKQLRDPPDLRTLLPGEPLADVTMRMLARNPDARPLPVDLRPSLRAL
jgi:serine/threonine protein kinase